MFRHTLQEVLSLPAVSVAPRPELWGIYAAIPGAIEYGEGTTATAVSHLTN
jgi:hypothetical protein